MIIKNVQDYNFAHNELKKLCSIHDEHLTDGQMKRINYLIETMYKFETLSESTKTEYSGNGQQDLTQVKK